MLIHFSTDQLLLLSWTKTETIPFADIERVFPRVLHTWYSLYTPTKITVINGPWSFTQLRVASIACNILNISQSMQIDFLDISKIDLYQKAMEVWHLPWVWVVFMGQRKKMWLIEIWNPEPRIVDEDTILSLIGWRDYYVDSMFYPHPVLSFLAPQNMIHFSQESDQFLDITYQWQVKHIDLSGLGNVCKELEARYMMEPMLG
jgi:hypothetical protein